MSHALTSPNTPTPLSRPSHITLSHKTTIPAQQGIFSPSPFPNVEVQRTRYYETKNRMAKYARIASNGCECAEGFDVGDAHDSDFVISYTMANGKSYIRYIERSEVFDEALDDVGKNAGIRDTAEDAMEDVEGDEKQRKDEVQTEPEESAVSLDLSISLSSSPSAIVQDPLPNATLYTVTKSFNTAGKSHLLCMDRSPFPPHSVIYGFSGGDLAVYDRVTERNPSTGLMQSRFLPRRFNAKKFDSTNVTSVKWFTEHLFFAAFASGYVYAFDLRIEQENMPIAHTSSPASPNSEKDGGSTSSATSSTSTATASNGGSPSDTASSNSSSTKSNSATSKTPKRFERILSIKDYLRPPYTSHVWKNERDKNPVVRLDAGNGVRVNDIAFSPDQNYMALACSDGFLRVMDIHNSKTRFRLHVAFRSLFGAVHCCCWTPDSCYVISGGEDDSVNVYSIAERELLVRGEGHESFVQRILVDKRFEDEEFYRLISCGQDCQLLVWELDPPQPRNGRRSEGSRNVQIVLKGAPKKLQTVGAGEGKKQSAASEADHTSDASRAEDNEMSRIVFPASQAEIPVFDPVQSFCQRNGGPIWDCAFLGRQDVATINDQGTVVIYRLFEDKENVVCDAQLSSPQDGADRTDVER